MRLNLPEPWNPHIEAILADPGPVVVVGDVDTGKTTFCAILANRALESGITTSVIDCDLGQSEIGPPGTIGLGRVQSAIETLSDVKPKALRFVGDTTPAGHLLSVAVAVRQLADKLAARETRLLIVDTPGLVKGLVGRKLQSALIEVLPARHIVAFQTSVESEHLLRYYDARLQCSVHRLPKAIGIKARTPAMRAQRRTVRFQEYFLHAESHEMPLASLVTDGTWLRSGEILEPRYQKFAESALNAEVLHGERMERGIYLVVKSEYNRQGVEQLQEQFRTRSVAIVPSSRYLNLLVGLHDDRLELLALGIVKGIGFRSQIISVHTPLRSIAPVRAIRFGVLKVRPDGTEIGRLRPGGL